MAGHRGRQLVQVVENLSRSDHSQYEMQAEKISSVVQLWTDIGAMIAGKYAPEEREAGPEVDGSANRRGCGEDTECDGRTRAVPVFLPARHRESGYRRHQQAYRPVSDRRHQLPWRVLRPTVIGSQVGCERRPLRGESGTMGHPDEWWVFPPPEGVNSTERDILALDYFYEITPWPPTESPG